jgi:hypothetical protein
MGETDYQSFDESAYKPSEPVNPLPALVLGVLLFMLSWATAAMMLFLWTQGTFRCTPVTLTLSVPVCS